MALVPADYVSSWQGQHLFGLLSKINFKQKKQSKAIKTYKQKIADLESALEEVKAKCKKRKVKVDELEKKVHRAEEFVQSMMQDGIIQMNSQERDNKRFPIGEPILPPSFMSYPQQGFPRSPFKHTNSLTTQELESSESEGDSSSASSTNSKRTKYDPSLLIGYSAWEASMWNSSRNSYQPHIDESSSRQKHVHNVQLSKEHARRDLFTMTPSKDSLVEPKESDSTFGCRVCSETFDTKKDLKAHRKANAVYSCDSCSDEFHTRKLLRRHVRHRHGRGENMEMGEQELSHKARTSSTEELADAPSENLFQCVVCFLKMKTKKELKRHTKNLHQIVSSSNESKHFTKTADVSEPAEGVKISSPPVESCKTSAVQPENNLIDEKLSIKTDSGSENTPKRKRRCTLCQPNEWMEFNKLTSHWDVKHPGTVYHKCPACPSGFLEQRYLSKHISIFHPEHINQDGTNETPQTGKKRKKFVIHKKCKTPDANVGLPHPDPHPIPVNSPEKVTTPVSTVRQSPRKVGSVDLEHQMVNSDANSMSAPGISTLFACNMCGRKFDSWIVFKDHALSHENAKPLERRKILAERGSVPTKKYVCQLCSKVAGSYDYFVEHYINAHALQKDHQCNGCFTSFSTKALLVKHSSKCKH